MKRTTPLIAAIAVWALALPASAAVITGISGFRVTTGGATYSWSSKLLDAQPTSDPAAGDIVTSVSGNNTGWTDDLGFDFGSDYATKTFTHVYMLQGSYHDTDVLANYYWSNDTGRDAGDVAAPNLNLFNYASYSNSHDGQWELEFTDLAGVTPQARYLIAEKVSGNGGNYGYEVAFVNTVPEPASLALLTLTALPLLRRRR